MTRNNNIVVLVAEDDLDLREIIVFEIESQFNAKIYQASTGEEAIQLLKSHPEIQYVISDYNMPKGTGGYVFLEMKKLNLNIPFVLCSTVHPSDVAELAPYADKILTVEKPNVNKVTTVLYTLLESSSALSSRPDYIPISTRLIKGMGPLKHDIYLKLSEEKYVKIMLSGDIFSVEDYNKYAAKNVFTAYVSSTQAREFISDYSNSIMNMLAAKDLPEEKAFELSERLFTTSLQLVKSLGATPEVQELVMNSTKTALKCIGAESDLNILLKRIYSSAKENEFLPSHSLMAGQIACHIAIKLGWGSELTLHKLLMAGMLHDATLTSDSIKSLSKLDSEEHTDLSTLSIEEKSFVLKHPEQAANLARLFKHMPADVDTIVMQHHERPDGTGLPQKLTHTHISPLGAVFIVAHDIVTKILANQDAKDLESWLASYKQNVPEHYKFGNFKKIYSVL